MVEIPYPTDYERMRDNIRAELQAQRAMVDLPLDDSTLDRLADGIATNLDYGFSVEWRPRWVKGDEPQRWAEPPGDRPTDHYVECLRCRRITMHGSAAEADAWWASHVRDDHS